MAASGMRTQTSVDRPHSARAGGQPPADGLDLLDSELRRTGRQLGGRERFRVLAPLAAAFAVIAVVAGLGLASSDLGGPAGLTWTPAIGSVEQLANEFLRQSTRMIMPSTRRFSTRECRLRIQHRFLLSAMHQLLTPTSP